VKTIFSTTDVHARERFDYWHDVACKNLVEHDSNPGCRQTFQAELQSEGLADLGLVLFENSPMTVSHTARHMAHASTDELFVCRQIAGVLALEQDNREVVLESGDFTLLDPRVPYAGKFAEGSRLLVLKFPRRLLEARVGKTQLMTARCMKPSEAENSLTSAFLAMLPRHTGRLGQAAEEIAKDQVLDLVAVSLAKGMEGSGPRISSARSLALVRLRAASNRDLSIRLSTQGLSPAPQESVYDTQMPRLLKRARQSCVSFQRDAFHAAERRLKIRCKYTGQ